MNKVNFGNNKFCGPSVMSAICGISTDEASAVISRITGRAKVRGVYLSELKRAFELAGYPVEQIEPTGQSVFGCLFSLHGKDGYYVFMVPGHFIAIEMNGNHKYICDNHSKEPINVSNSARLGQKVIGLLKVSKS